MGEHVSGRVGHGNVFAYMPILYIHRGLTDKQELA